MAPDENLESLQPKLREGEGLGGLTLRDYDVIAIAVRRPLELAVGVPVRQPVARRT